MPFYESESEILGMLEKGNEEQRIWAICSIDYKKKSNYDLVWRIFLSDINWRVQGNALTLALHIKPEKIWEILDYVLEHDRSNNIFTRRVAKRLLELYQQNKL